LPQSSAIDALRTTAAIRDRAAALYALAAADQLTNFQVDGDRWDAVTDYVERITRQAYPDLAIPFHSRWRHFPAAPLAAVLGDLRGAARARAQIDVVIPSVLLDAGAGDRWTYVDAFGQSWSRSQGLAVASLEMFAQGLFSHTGKRETTAIGLQQITLEQLAAAFQVTSANPLVGLEGRLALLHRLGAAIGQQPEIFGESARLGNLLDQWLVEPHLSAETILQTILTTFSDVWPSGQMCDRVNLGDVWIHPQLPPWPGTDLGYIPFHKLSQWLTYSLLEPLQELGLSVGHIDRLTGLAEYRNGGLFLDLGLLRLRTSAIADVAHPPDATVIVEWRGLTVHLLDMLADRLRQRWGMDAHQLPLAKVLQGGTWQAGRSIAQERRADGSPPLRSISDGTIF
jgi:Protein of unknown function (DUF1688)